MSPDKVDPILLASFDDFRMSRGERRDLKEALTEFDSSADTLSYFRSRAFHIVRSLDDADVALDWLEVVIKTLSTPTAATPAKNADVDICFSPGEACRQLILRELRNTRTHADICVFTITDNELREGIVQAHKRGVNIRLISDNDKALDRGSDVEWLEKEGIATRVDQSEHHMHHKYAIFDGKRLLTGSYNWTRSAADFNQENIVVMEDAGALKAFSAHFEELWAKLG